MTLSEIKAFIKVSSKQKITEQIQFIIGTAIGAQSDKKGLKKVVKDLEKNLEDIRTSKE